jgi:hypothetical protein
MNDHTEDHGARRSDGPAKIVLAVQGPAEEAVADWAHGAFTDLPGTIRETDHGYVYRLCPAS